MSDKPKKLTEDSMAPMAEALDQSTDEETATKYTASLSAEQQLVNSTAQDFKSTPRHLDDDSLYRISQQYVPGSQAMVDAIVAGVVDHLKLFIAQAFDEAIAAKQPECSGNRD